MLMKKFIILAAALMFTPLLANAKPRVAARIYSCVVNADVIDNSFALLIGPVNIKGQGVVRCFTPGVQPVEREAIIEIYGVSIGRIAIPTGQMGSMSIASAEIGLTSIEKMFGDYRLSASINGQFGDNRLGLSRDFISFSHKGNLATGVSIVFQKGGTFGLGLDISITGMAILTPEQYAEKKFREEQAWMNRQSHSN